MTAMVAGVVQAPNATLAGSTVADARSLREGSICRSWRSRRCRHKAGLTPRLQAGDLQVLFAEITAANL